MFSIDQVLGYIAAIGGLLFVFFIAWQSKSAGQTEAKEAQENEALDNIMAGNAIDDKYRRDADYRRAADDRFDSEGGTVMAGELLVFNGIEHDKWERIAKGAPVTIPVTKYSGVAENSGYKIQWFYDKAARKLTLQVKDKPFIVPMSMIEDRIRKLVEEA